MRKTASERLSAGQQAEVEALAALADEGIDTSDLPEVLDRSHASRGRFYRPVIPTIVDWNLCRLPPTNPSPACGGGRVGGRFRASGSGRRSPAKAPVTPRGPPPTPPSGLPHAHISTKGVF